MLNSLQENKFIPEKRSDFGMHQTRPLLLSPPTLTARDHGIGRSRRGSRPSATKPGGEQQAVRHASGHRISTTLGGRGPAGSLVRRKNVASLPLALHCYRLSTHVSQVLIKLPPPPHFRGLLQKYSNYMPLLVWDGSLFKQN